MMKLLVVVLPFLALVALVQAQGCVQKNIGNGLYCVCDENGCDTVPELGDVSQTMKMYFTSASTPGFNEFFPEYTNVVDPLATIVSVQNDEHQTIIGFGGAFTDAASINLQMLSEKLRQMILEAYFGDNGIEYNICRVPLGACDFSPRPYTLDDTADNTEDLGLEQFALQDEDLNYKIPTILQAQQIRGGKQLDLFASAWTAPLWMKDKQVWHGGSQLKKEYYQVWADYHMKFFDAYLAAGVKYWGLTVGNEPLTGYMTGTTIPSMGWDTMGQSEYIINNLGPTLRNSQHSDLKMMILDDSLNVVAYMAGPMLNNSDVLQYVDGVATHWYQDGALDGDIRNLAKTDKKDVFLLETETCHFITEPLLGSWQRAVEYIDDIITDLQYDYAGWVEWNLVLNATGGPSHINVLADAPIVLNAELTEFYKQPTFYVVGHFSKFILPGSVRLGAEPANSVLRSVAFLRPDGLKAVVMHNFNLDPIPVQIEDNGKYSSVIQLQPQSINTVIYTP